MTEVPLPPESDTLGVFNDLALHGFPPTSNESWPTRPLEYMADETDPELIPAGVDLNKHSI